MGFTPSQQTAIDTEGSNIIVSAGAGSGKTAVLTERVIRKLKQGIPVNKLLILTFTKEAANEMKSRIRKAIIDNKLNDQLDLLDLAYITTFDSYAFSLVKKYHYLHNISNDIKIVDESVITIFKYKIIDNIFSNMYDNAEFCNFINDFCIKDDGLVKDMIINLSSKLDLLINKEEYLDTYIDKYYNSNYIDSLIDKYIGIIHDNINLLHDVYNELISYCSDNLVNKLDNYLKPLFNGSDYASLVLFTKMDPVRMVGVSEEGIKVKEEFKELIDKIKQLLRFNDIDEIKESILSTKKYISVIIDIIKELDECVYSYKNKNEIYEFTDIALMAIKTVRDYDNIREEIKNYFNEIMVDEYQDTSNIQEEFLSYIDNNNIYMVGDIKQAIYRFRNANPYIFQKKYDKYSNNDGGIKIDLLKNFRSRCETLNNINEIFNLIMDNDIGNANYLESHNMVYGNTLYDNEDTGHNNNLEIYNYSLNEDELAYEKELFIVSEDIKEKINNNYLVFDKDSKSLRSIRYSDICIITDRYRYFDTYKKILEYNEIPSVLYMDVSITNDVMFKVIKNLIDLVNHIGNNNLDDKFKYLFVSITRSFIFSYDDNKIYEIVNNNRYYDSNIYKIAKEIDLSMPLINVINDIIYKYNIYDKLTILTDIEKNILTIDNIIGIASSLNEIGYSISDFTNYLDDLIDMGLDIKYSLNTNDSNAVKVMNIHKSKGLEFSLCYYVGLNNKFNFSDVTSRALYDTDYGIIMPYLKEDKLESTIIKDLSIYKYYLEEVSEKIRLFYVALTRCREKMIILANMDDNRDGYSHLVPYSVRYKYKSFLDILNSINVIDKYIVSKDIQVDKNYDIIKLKKIDLGNNTDKVIHKSINIDRSRRDNKHFSKENIHVYSKEELDNMNYGTKIHNELEYSNFDNTDNEIIKNLLKHIDNNYINIYQEYEFSYMLDNIQYNGIIDLMIEYEDDIYIIDYKLKDISDKEYIKQLEGYKNYISSISNKNVKTYLYSIMEDNFMEV